MSSSSSSHDEINRVLLLGESSIGKRFLLSRLIRQSLPDRPLHESDESDGRREGSSSGRERSVPFRSFEWSLSTRYYDANLCFMLPEIDFSSEAVLTLVASSHSRQAQGVMMMYDPASMRSYRDIKKYAALASQGSDRVLLLVANERVKGSANAEIMEEAREWSIENGIEHVLVPFIDVEAEAAPVNDSSERDRDRGRDEGIPRLLDAFSANEWNYMRLKENVGVGRSMDLSDLNAEDENLDAEVAEGDDDDNVAFDDEPAYEHLTSMDEESVSAHITELRSQLAGLGVDSPQRAELERNIQVAEALQEEDSEHLEQTMAQFESLFENMRELRAESRRAIQSTGDSGVQLSSSDVERRERAERLLMSMLGALGSHED